jgi:uncharacterized phage protein (TIGR02218 family)
MRYVPPALQAHLDSGETTMTLIMRIDPVTPGYPSVGCTMLDQPLTYDDGLGSLTYAATIGMTPSTLQSTSSMGVDNGETQHLVPEGDMGISEEILNSGVYDYAKYRLYWVNYMDLSMGHIAITRGELGQIRVEEGMTFWNEITSLSKKLKTPIVKKSSRTCRATFGSQPIGTGGGVYEERQPCGKDISAMWSATFTVTAVGLETNRTFTAAGMGAAAATYQPGMVKWIAGDNAGRQYDVEEQPGAGVVSLDDETMFPVQIGDTFQIRADCSKWWEGANGCQAHHSTAWVLHYRGEPFLKPQESDSVITPGASLGKGLG